MTWMDLKIDGVADIEKIIGEYDIGEILKTPWGKFRVKVYQKQDGTYDAITNLMYIDETGYERGGYGSGKTEEEALESCIKDFLSYLPEDRRLTEKDFSTADPYDF